MNFKDAVRTQFTVADFMVKSYLSDLTDKEILARPVPGANHVAWQLGHLISAETRLVEAAAPDTMPALPAGFAERHTKDTAASDNPTDFLSKDEYMTLAKLVRTAVLKALDGMSEADLDKPVSGRVPPWVKCAGDCFVTAGGHWVLHAGQWVVLRRQLGRVRQF
jgi:DinB superfamily